MRMQVHLDIKYVVGMFTCIFFLQNYHFNFLYIYFYIWKHGELGHTSLFIYYIYILIIFLNKLIFFYQQ